MEQVGIIGFGSMGSMLARALLRGGVEAQRLGISTRTPERAADFLKEHPGARFFATPQELAARGGILFLAVPPKEIKPVLDRIRNALPAGTRLVSLAAGVTLSELESAVPCPVSRIIPNVCAEADAGVYLYMAGIRESEAGARETERLLSSSGTVVRVDEGDIETLTEVTSCGPGLYAAFFDEFANAAERARSYKIAGELSGTDNGVRSDIRELLRETAAGLARLQAGTAMDYPRIIERVARKGGITEIGVALLRERLPGLLDEIFSRSLARHAERATEYRAQFAANDIIEGNPEATKPRLRERFRSSDAAIEIEEYALNAWPTLETRISRGCVLRSARGYTRRSNSANPLYARNGDEAAVIGACEAFFAERKAVPRFKILDVAAYRALDRALEERGYGKEAESLVMTLPFGDRAPITSKSAAPSPVAESEAESSGTGDIAVSVGTDFTDEWTEAFARAGSLSPKDADTARLLLAAVPENRVVVSAVTEGRIVAFAYAAIENGHAGIFDVMVEEGLRGKGVGKRVMEALLPGAAARGARTAYLQVSENNDAARHMYERLGFAERYRYWYRSRR